LQCLPDLLQHGFSLLKHVTIPKTQNLKSPLLDILITPHVVVMLCLVLPTVRFNNKLGFQAGEICDVTTYRYLSPKSPVRDLAPP